jgi:hypothetical protein
MPAGRPSTYSHEVAEQICRGIAEGNSLISVLKEDDELPSYTTIMKWLKDIPEFADNYARAREDQADHDADKISDIAERVVKGLIEPQAARVAIDAYKWAAGKRKPKVYGDKVAIGGASDLPPIQTSKQLDVSNLSLEELEVLGAALQKSIKDE